MNLAELKEAYKARKLALDSAKKEEEKYKALLKDAMLEAGESDYTDEAGYRFERIVQERKSMDEEKLLAELHERNLTSCIATKEVVDEDATLKAVEAGELPQEVLADIVLNPSFLPEGLADYYKINKAMIDQCDAIYVLLHSENSVGTKKEIEYAKSTCKQVIYQQEAETKEKEWGWKKDPYIYPRSFYSPVGYTPWDPWGRRL